MSYRKNPDNEMNAGRNVMIMQSRRLNNVKRNFAVGIRQAAAAGHSNKELRYKAKANKEV